MNKIHAAAVKKRFLQWRNKVSVFSRKFLCLPASFAVGGAKVGGITKLISLKNLQNYLSFTLLLTAAGFEQGNY